MRVGPCEAGWPPWLQAAEAEAKRLKRERQEEAPESDSEDEAESAAAASQVGAGLKRARRDERGRWQAESDELRALKWAQLARGVAPSTVSANIEDVRAVPCTGPGAIRGRLSVNLLWTEQGESRRGQPVLARSPFWGLEHVTRARVATLSTPRRVLTPKRSFAGRPLQCGYAFHALSH